MKQIKIKGGKELTGEIKISGAKNSAVALIPAALLSNEITVIDNVPNISDIESLIEILEFLNVKVTYENKKMVIDPTNLVNKEIPERISKKLRASYYFMSSLLGKFRHVEMYFPGGCSIGARPIDQTLKGFRALGATILEDGNKFTIDAKELKAGHIYLDMPSVGATINTILSSVLASGETIIENAAKEPEIVNVATFLNNMGAKITGAGTSEIRIVGVNKLGSGFTEVIPDRIEAGTYVIAGALVGKNLKISNLIPEHIESLTLKLNEMNIPLEIGTDYIIISKGENLEPVSLKTLGYPGFPTDLQQPVTVLLTQCNGLSTLEETIYENRFQNVPYLNLMGADIKVENRKLFINGKTNLIGSNVIATDLRAGACLVLAGLKASGITYISDIEHILRGYEGIIEKLQNVGAQIELTQA